MNHFAHLTMLGVPSYPHRVPSATQVTFISEGLGVVVAAVCQRPLGLVILLRPQRRRIRDHCFNGLHCLPMSKGNLWCELAIHMHAAAGKGHLGHDAVLAANTITYLKRVNHQHCAISRSPFRGTPISKAVGGSSASARGRRPGSDSEACVAASTACRSLKKGALASFLRSLTEMLAPGSPGYAGSASGSSGSKHTPTL